MRHGRVGGGVDGREGGIIAWFGQAAEQAVDQAGAIQRQRNGLAHAAIGQRPGIAAHMHFAVGGGRDIDDFHVRIADQALCALHGDLPDHVHLVVFQRQDFRLLIGIEAEFRSVRQRRLAPIGGVAHEIGPHFLGVSIKPERAGAIKIFLEIAVVIGGQHDGVVVFRADEIRKIAVRRFQFEAHGQIIDLLCAAGGEHPAHHGEGV